MSSFSVKTFLWLKLHVNFHHLSGSYYPRMVSDSRLGNLGSEKGLLKYRKVAASGRMAMVQMPRLVHTLLIITVFGCGDQAHAPCGWVFG